EIFDWSLEETTAEVRRRRAERGSATACPGQRRSPSGWSILRLGAEPRMRAALRRRSCRPRDLVKGVQRDVDHPLEVGCADALERAGSELVLDALGDPELSVAFARRPLDAKLAASVANPYEDLCGRFGGAAAREEAACRRQLHKHELRFPPIVELEERGAMHS